MGADYPLVLSAMSRRKTGYRWRRALVVDRFEAYCASLEDVKWLFGQSKIAVIPLAEITPTTTPAGGAPYTYS